MPRTYKNKEKFIQDSKEFKVINNSAMNYIYQDDKYKFTVDLFFNYEDKNQHIFRIEKAIAFKKIGRKLKTSDSVLIMNWLKDTEIDKPENWPNYYKIISPVILYFEIPEQDRIKLYSEFKETTKFKLMKAIKKLETIIPLLQDYQETYCIDELKYILHRFEFYKNYLAELNTRTSKFKLLDIFLLPLIQELTKKGYSKNMQSEHISWIFYLGKFYNISKIDLETIRLQIRKMI